jgi:thioesterase domain-containing protein/acyl carrier protein
VGYVVCGDEVGGEEVRRVVGERVPEYMVPQRLVRVRALPRTANGKLDRQKLAMETATESWGKANEDQRNTGKVCVQPRDGIEHQLLSIWEEVLHRRPIGITDNFFDLGGHSMLAVRLMALLYEEFGQDLPLATLLQHPTVEELAVILRQQVQSGEPHLALVPIQPRGTKRPFFCVHPSGGTVFCYSNLARYLGAEQPFYGLQTPEFMAGETHLHIEDMAAHYINAIRAVQPRGPYLLGGWSLGGIVAFEMAQQLQRQGQGIALLAVIDSSAPDASVTQELAELDLGDAHLAGVILQSIHVVAPEEGFHQLEPEEQLAYALLASKRLIAIPRDTSLEQLRFLARVREINLHASRQYIPRVYPSRIELFLSEGSTEREGVVQESVSGAIITHNIEKWQKLAGGVGVHPLPGKHREIMEEPNVRFLATALSACIEHIPG